MRQISLLTIFCLTFWGCNLTTEKKSGPVDSLKSSKQEIGKKFFVYDAIDYYSGDFDESIIDDLYDNQSKLELDSFKLGIILGDIPKSISDLEFINKLEKVGYKRTRIDKSKFDSIDNIFVEKSATEYMETACIYVYRDILIFKKGDKVVGTAKVCFSCMAKQIHGTTANTVYFGQEGDYVRLERILRQ